MKTLILLSLLLASCSHVQEQRKINIRVTAYCPQEKDHIKYKNKSAAGTNLIEGKSIAANWADFPVGTVLKFNDNLYSVDDYGSFILKQHSLPTIDLFVSSRKEMNNWGVREVEAEIIKWGDYAKSAHILKDRLKYKHCRIMMEKIQEKL